MGIRLALLLSLVAASAAAANQIYRTVDENGNVVFTDVPPVTRDGQPDGQKVTVEPANIYVPPVLVVPPPATILTDAAGYYSELAVVDPVEDATIRDNAGKLLIQAVITPALRVDHRLLLNLDGAPTEVEAEEGVFELSNVDRGTHTVAARVVNRDGEVQMESQPVTFNMLRYSLPAAPAPTPKPLPKN